MHVSAGSLESDAGGSRTTPCNLLSGNLSFFRVLFLSKMMGGNALGASQWVRFQEAAHFGLLSQGTHVATCTMIPLKTTPRNHEVRGSDRGFSVSSCSFLLPLLPQRSTVHGLG